MKTCSCQLHLLLPVRSVSFFVLCSIYQFACLVMHTAHCCPHRERIPVSKRDASILFVYSLECLCSRADQSIPVGIADPPVLSRWPTMLSCYLAICRFQTPFLHHLHLLLPSSFSPISGSSATVLYHISFYSAQLSQSQPSLSCKQCSLITIAPVRFLFSLILHKKSKAVACSSGLNNCLYTTAPVSFGCAT